MRPELYKYDAHFYVKSFVTRFSLRSHGIMESHVFLFFVTYYLICILGRNAFCESTLVKVFSSINDTTEINRKSIFDIEEIQPIKTETSLNRITLKGNLSKFESLQTEDSLLVKRISESEILNSFRRARCSRYCIQQLNAHTKKKIEVSSDSYVCISWFVGNRNEKVDFSLEHIAEMDLSREISVDNKNLTLLNNCQVYLDSNYNVMNIDEKSINRYNKFYSKFNRQNNEIFGNPFLNVIPRLSEKVLVHRPNLSGYTETNFHIDHNITGIIIKVSGNVTRAVLVIPINRTMRSLGIIMSLARTYSTKGVVSGARNLPSGEWCVKLTGVENSKYDFDVVALVETNEEHNSRDAIIDINSTIAYEENKNFDETAKTNKNVTNDQINSISLRDSEVNNNTKLVFERSIEITDSRSNEETTMYDFPPFFSTEFAAIQNVTDYSTLHNNSLTSYGDFKILQKNTSDKETFNENIFVRDKQQKIQARMSEVASLNEDVDMDTKFAIKNVSMRVSDHIQESSLDITRHSNEDLGKRKTVIEVNSNSNLIAAAGTRHRVNFDISNPCFLPVRYAIRARSAPFQIYGFQPIYTWLYPGQTSQIAVDILIPLGSQDTVNTLTLSVDGTEISEKTVYVYVRNTFTKINDDVRPTIEYTFNSNCAGKTDKKYCEKTTWSADITVHDPDSGLKRVLSSPNDIYPRTTFISGTKDPVKFYYISTCCFTTAKITAIDISNNQYSRTLDVTVWDNLSQGEIAAITLGALLLLFLLILLIIAIIYCIRKRNSHDLPYTQRYGSRQPPRSERTSF